MRSAALASALLCAALGLALAFAHDRARMQGLIALVATACVFAFASLPPAWRESVFLGCWISTTVSAAAVHWRRGMGSRAVLALSVNAGFWSGAVIAVAGSHVDVLKALPCVLVSVPGAWVVGKQAPIALKVVSSWLMAVALLAATLQLLPVTPGYLPDHLE